MPCYFHERHAHSTKHQVLKKGAYYLVCFCFLKRFYIKKCLKNLFISNVSIFFEENYFFKMSLHDMQGCSESIEFYMPKILEVISDEMAREVSVHFCGLLLSLDVA